MTADPKPAKRIVDKSAVAAKLRSDSRCRACGSYASEGHHILPKGQRGDDVAENIVPLCLLCHRRYHDSGYLPLSLQDDERAYLDGKLGKYAATDFLGRHYGT